MTKLGFYASWAASTWFGLLHQRKYSATWDVEINALIDENWSTAKPAYCTVILGDCELWVENKYYAYGHCYSRYGRNSVQYRPSLKTMFRIARLVEYLESQQCHA